MRRWRLTSIGSFRSRRNTDKVVPKKSADELKEERDLLERLQAGIALNKMPPR